MALKVLKSADHSRLYTVLGEQSANHQQSLETGRTFICSIYSVATVKSMTSARYALHTKKTRGNAVCVKSLPPTDANLSYHILRAHYEVMLWKLIAVTHVAVILKDCHAHHTVFVLGKRCVSILNL